MGVTGKIFPVTNIKKSIIHTTISNHKDKIFNTNIIKKHIEICKEEKVTSFTNIFSTVNLLEFLNIQEGLNEYFECFFIKGNYAWVSVSNNNHYRYFTRSKSGVTHSLDFIDLYSIYANTKTISKTITAIRKTFGVKFDDNWTLKQREKYEQNQNMIQSEEYKSKYPNLYAVTKKHLNILHILNEIGDDKLMGKGMEFKGNAIFFCSMNYIRGNYMKDSTTSMINQVINLFAVLGLINKVPEIDIPMEFITIAKDRMKIDKCRYNHVSFFSIPDLQSVLNIAEERAIIILNNKVKYYTITKNVVRKVFGEEIMNEVYVQKTRSDKPSKSGLKKEEEMMKYLFNISVIDHGFASKELLRKQTDVTGKTFEKIWIDLVGSVEHVLTRPNKSMKSRHNLITNEHVLIVKEKYKIA